MRCICVATVVIGSVLHYMASLLPTWVVDGPDRDHFLAADAAEPCPQYEHSTFRWLLHKARRVAVHHAKDIIGAEAVMFHVVCMDCVVRASPPFGRV